MKKFLIILIAFTAVLISCNNYETYGDKKDKERNAISKFIADSSIMVISESQFEQQGNTTNLARNEFVKLSKSGVYLQIVREGCGNELEEGKLVGILCRFEEFNILSDSVQLSNMLLSRSTYLDKMNVTRTGSTITIGTSKHLTFHITS